MTNDDNMKTVLDAGRKLGDINGRFAHLADPMTVNGPSVPVGVVSGPAGETKLMVLTDVLAEIEKRAAGPRRRIGTTEITEIKSFIDFITRWGSSNTIVYADTEDLSLTAVIDDHPLGTEMVAPATAWRTFRAVYSCPRSPEWLAWSEVCKGEPLTQMEFADLVEARLEDLISGVVCSPPRPGAPEPLDVLTMARGLSIKTKGEFRRDIDPTTGNQLLIYKTQTDEGSTPIPRSFFLAVPVFAGGKRYEVEVRVRFTLNENSPRFALAMHRAAEIEAHAFQEVRDEVTAATGRLLLAGTPA